MILPTILSMSGQAWLFAGMVVMGAVVGVFYDVFRVIRKTARHATWVVQLEDMIFWLAATGAIFYFSLVQNYGEMRVFYLIGVACGLALYFATVSHVVRFIAVGAVTIIKRVVAGTVRIIAWPIRAMCKKMRPHCKKIKYFARNKMKKTVRNIIILRKKV